MSWWNPFAILARHEKRLTSLDKAITAHVTASISRMDLVEKQQRDLSTMICTHKDDNAQRLERIGQIVVDLDKRLRGHSWARRMMVAYRIITALTCLSGVLVGGTIVLYRPDSLPYLARIVASAFQK